MQEHSFGIIPFIDKGGERLFLLVQHRDGHWGFPKGHKEAGESDMAAAKREFEEEAGIKDYNILGEKTFIERYEFKKGGEAISKTVSYFLAAAHSPNVVIQEKEIADYRWAAFEDALKLITFKEGREMLRDARDYLMFR
jgi:8-oxo-dGTP pyrophosphatase MutT (NUDIX family)